MLILEGMDLVLLCTRDFFFYFILSLIMEINELSGTFLILELINQQRGWRCQEPY